MSVSVAERITDIAGHQPDEAAIINALPNGSESIVSWKELERRSRERASILKKAADPLAGIGVLCVPAHNTPAAIVDIVAAARAGITILPLDPNLPQEPREALLRNIRKNYGPTIEVQGSEVKTEGRTGENAQRPAKYILTTGGTSGAAKVVVHPGPITYDSRRTPSLLLRSTGWRTAQRQYIIGPLYHAGPFTYCITGILDANTIIVSGHFEPARVLGNIERYGVNWFQFTPTHMARLAVACGPEMERPGFPSIRGILHSAAACPHQTKREWLDLIGPERIYELYATTEDIGCTLASGAEWLRRPGTVGRGIFTQIRILDEGLRQLRPGQVGRIFMRKALPSAEDALYLDRALSSAQKEGYRSVGDYGRLDDDGYLYIEPRREDMFTVGGENVYPAKIESIISEHPLVSDVAVIGIPDETFGSRVAAAICTRENAQLSLAELIAHCRGRLASFELPGLVRQVGQLPRNEAGKLQRWRLSGTFTEGDVHGG